MWCVKAPTQISRDARNEEAGMEFADIDLKSGSDDLYIFFGGLAGGLAMPPFEFYSAASILDHNKIFVRDLGQTWYHHTPGLGDPTVAGLQGFLEGQISAIAPRRVRFIGNSMGGFAAMLFCCRIGQGEAIAFSPQTFISPVLKLRHLDARWPRQILKTWLTRNGGDRVWDLKPVLQDSSSHVKIRIYASRSDGLDTIHAERVQDCSGVEVTLLDEGGHSVVKLLRNSGQLKDILLG